MFAINNSINDIIFDEPKQNPNYLQDERLLSQWQQLVHEIMGPAGDVAREKEKEQIKKAIGTKVEIKDGLIIKK